MERLRLMAIAGLVALAAVAPYVLIPTYHVDVEVPQYLEATPSVRVAFRSHALDDASDAYCEANGTYVVGRTLKPLFNVNIPQSTNVVQRYTQQKEFVWMSMTTPSWLFSFALLQFGYVSIVVVSAFNAETGLSLRDSIVVPVVGPLVGPMWVPNEEGRYGPRAAGHRVIFDTQFIPGFGAMLRNTRVSVTFSHRSVQFNVRGAFRKQNSKTLRQPVRFEARGEFDLPLNFLGMVYPIGPNRAAAVAKIAGAPATRPLSLRIDKEQYYLPKGAGSMDYTRGLLRRNTTWHWASLSLSSGVGVHLSSGTYDIDGVSQESTVFCDKGAEYVDQKVIFTKQHVKRPARETTWQVHAGNVVNLIFHPVDGHDGASNLHLVNINLEHVWGTYSGHISCSGARHEFAGVPGVLEEHYALW